MNRQISSLTLLELLIALTLFSVVVLALSSINLFTHFQARDTEHRARLQNEAACALEHMSKWISEGIGDVNNLAINVIPIGAGAGDTAIKIRIDANGNGRADPPAALPGPGNDTMIAYRWNRISNQLWFCRACQDFPICNACIPAWGSANEVIARGVIYFGTPSPPALPGPPLPIENRVPVQLQICDDPTNPATCGTANNPMITMRTTIVIPAVSTR